MNSDDGYTIYCSKCGAEMNSNSRYCMKCGNLNYEHEANKNMRRFMPKRRKKYQVGSGMHFSNPDTSNNKDLRMSVSTRTGNKTFCFLLNFGIYIALIVLGFLVSTGLSLDLETIGTSAFPKFAIYVSLFFLYTYALELIFMKCNRAWWEALIPFYNYLVLGDIVFENKWIGALFFIPGVNVIFLCVCFYKLGKSFHVKEVLCAILPILYIPILGFGSCIYNGYLYVSSDSQRETEKEYQYRKIFLFTIMLFLLLGFGFIFMNEMTRTDGKKSFIDGYYFTYASHSIVSKVEKKIANGDVNCKYSNYSETSGVYYFSFGSVGEKTFLLLYDIREPIKGYVKVDNTSGESKIYVSLSDGTFGFRETLADEVGPSSLEEYKKVEYVSRDMNTCKFVE